MSITIRCEFRDPGQANLAAMRLRRRGYTVSGPGDSLPGRAVFVAQAYGTPGGNTDGNRLLGALPPLAECGLLTGENLPKLSVLTDDTHAGDARLLLESLGARILS